MMQREITSASSWKNVTFCIGLFDVIHATMGCKMLGRNETWQCTQRFKGFYLTGKKKSNLWLVFKWPHFPYEKLRHKVYKVS